MNKIGEFLKQNSYILFANILSLLGFAAVAGCVVGEGNMLKLDNWLNEKIVLLWNPLLNKIMIFITNIASEVGLFILGVIVVGVLLYKKRWEMVLLTGFGLSAALVSKSLIKKIIHRTRPENGLVDYSTFSFPSGHATMATVFFLFVLYLFKDEIKWGCRQALKFSFIILNIVLFLSIGFSRVYLNVHWFSDVLAGFLLGIFWFTLSVLIFRRIKWSA